MITLEQFLALTFHGKKAYYEGTIKATKFSETMPFWVERIQTAIEANAPIALTGFEHLIEFYWDYKNDIIKKAI